MDLSNILDNYQVLHENIYVKRLIVLVVYIVIMKVVDLLIDKVLKRMAGLTKSTLDDRLVEFAHRPICWSVFWLGVLHALLVAPLVPPWQLVLPALVKTILILIWVIALVRIFNFIMQLKVESSSADDKIGMDVLLLLKNVLRVVIIATGVLWTLTVWKISLAPLFASAGIAGIAIALAAKDTLANFFGGISVFMDKAYKIGDYIILESGERGEVVEIGIRSTRMKTRDDVMITIPNSIIANSKVINESAPIPRFRIRVPVGVAYGTDLDEVEKVLMAVALANPKVVKDPAPRVRVRSFGDFSVNFQLLCWVEEPARRGLEIHNLLKATYQAFADNSIVIPFPQRDVHLFSEGEDG